MGNKTSIYNNEAADPEDNNLIVARETYERAIAIADNERQISIDKAITTYNEKVRIAADLYSESTGKIP